MSEEKKEQEAEQPTPVTDGGGIPIEPGKTDEPPVEPTGPGE
jgi:hypothetical protein